ncbi:hypothetical protein BDQ17DRAFT_1254958, partial [Cyathus striatus]
NVILFGSSGVGKSSVINMLPGVGDNPAISVTASSAKGATFTATRYVKNISGTHVNLFDTAGLNEGAQGTVPAIDAIESLHELIVTMPPNGISLLVYVIRAGRITVMTKQNYDMFWDTICHRHVKIVVVVTGLEYGDMDAWWDFNESAFKTYGMAFDGYACITALPSFPELYQRSREKVESLLSASLKDTIPWVPNSSIWLAEFLQKSIPTFLEKIGLNTKFLAPELYESLRKYGRMSEEMARREANKIARRYVEILPTKVCKIPYCKYVKEAKSIAAEWKDRSASTVNLYSSTTRPHSGAPRTQFRTMFPISL